MFHINSAPRARWAFLEKLSGYSREACQVFEPAVTIAIGCFYIAVLLFFQSLWEYHAMMSGLAITGKCTYLHYIICLYFYTICMPVDFVDHFIHENKYPQIL